MTPNEERAQLVAPMELIGKAIQQLNDLFRKTSYVVYEDSVRILSNKLTVLKNHDVYLENLNLS